MLAEVVIGLKRPKVHLQPRIFNKLNDHCHHWVKKCANEGIKPEIIILENMEFEPQNIDERENWLNSKERYWISHYKERGHKLTNILEGGEDRPILIGEKNPMYGKTHTDEVKERIAAVHRGKKRNMSEEARKKLSERFSGENNPFYGKKHSTETMEIIKSKLTGKKLPPRTEEYKKKLSESLKGRKLSESQIEQLKERNGENNPFFGRKHSEETKKKMREAQKKRFENRQ